MSNPNSTVGPIPPEQFTEAVNGLKSFIDSLKPYAVNLSEEEKKHIPKSGERTCAFVDKGIGYMKTNPEYMNGLMSEEVTSNNRLTQQQAIDLNEQVNIVYQLLNDLAIATGSEAYLSVLDYYNSVKRAADKGDAPAKQIAEDLGVIFKKSGGDPIPGIDLP